MGREGALGDGIDLGEGPPLGTWRRREVEREAAGGGWGGPVPRVLLALVFGRVRLQPSAHGSCLTPNSWVEGIARFILKVVETHGRWTTLLFIGGGAF